MLLGFSSRWRARAFSLGLSSHSGWFLRSSISRSTEFVTLRAAPVMKCFDTVHPSPSSAITLASDDRLPRARVVDLRTPGHALLFLLHPRRDILVFLNFDHPASRTLPDDHFVGGFNLLHHLCRGCVDDWRRSRSGESGAKHQPHCAPHYCTSRRSFSPLAHFDENGRVESRGIVLGEALTRRWLRARC